MGEIRRSPRRGPLPLRGRVEVSGLLLAAGELGAPIGEPVELGEVLRGEAGVRTSEQEITVFESLGFAALDVAVAHWIGMRAKQDGAGVQVAMDPSLTSDYSSASTTRARSCLKITEVRTSTISRRCVSRSRMKSLRWSLSRTAMWMRKSSFPEVT